MTHTEKELTELENPRTSVFGWALALFGLVALLVLADLWIDAREGAALPHVVAEGLAAGLAAVGAALAARRLAELLRAQRHALARSRDEALSWRAEADRWRAEAATALAGLSLAIDQQFDRWDLTPAEREVALLLLKGLSFKEVAALRDASERTVRQQAGAVYKKANLAGRAELAAFFFEDLMVGLPAEREKLR